MVSRTLYYQPVRTSSIDTKLFFYYFIATYYIVTPSLSKELVVQNKNPFMHILSVASSDIDAMGHVNNVVYVRWIQEVAAAHWNHQASATLQSKYAWVVLRHEIDYKNPAFLDDVVTGLTWVGDYNGARFDRFVKISANGKVVTEAKTTWCLLDAKTHRPIRIPDEIISLL